MSITFSSAKLVGTSHCMAVRLRHLSLSRTTSFFIYRLPIQETAFFIYRLPFQGTACCFLGQFYRLWHLALIRTRVFFIDRFPFHEMLFAFLDNFIVVTFHQATSVTDVDKNRGINLLNVILCSAWRSFVGFALSKVISVTPNP